MFISMRLSYRFTAFPLNYWSEIISLLNHLYHQTILLDLGITAILSYLDLDIEKLMVDYLSTLKN